MPVTTGHDHTEPFLTGLGYLAPYGFFASTDSPISTRKELATTIRMHDLVYFSREYRAFAFHEFCWRALLFRLGCHRTSDSRAKVVAALLWRLFSSYPSFRLGQLIPENQYFGAIKIRDSWLNRGLLVHDPVQDLPADARLGVHPTEHQHEAPIARRYTRRHILSASNRDHLCNP